MSKRGNARVAKLAVALPPKLHVEPKLLKLDLACGQSPREGFEGVDLYAPNAVHKVDLFKFPFPWADNSVAELHVSHFLEHLPAREVELHDCREGAGTLLGQDFLFAFMDECWRVLVPGGVMTAIVPCARSNRAFQDPTHRRFFVAETFGYFNKGWRELNKLDHYNVKCNFDSQVNPIIPVELTALHPEAQARRFNESWNTVMDWHAVLKAVKP